MSSCCMSCEDKKPGCHDGCIKYISETLADMSVKHEIHEEMGKAGRIYVYEKQAKKRMATKTNKSKLWRSKKK